MTETSSGIIIDTPQGIQAYAFLACVHGLALEIRVAKKYGVPPAACPTRGRALGAAKGWLADAGLYEPGRNLTRKEALKRMRVLAERMGIEVNLRAE